MMVFLFSVMAVIGVIAIALSVINAYINPQHFIWTTVFGLAFWEILIFNVVVFLFLLLTIDISRTSFVKIHCIYYTIFRMACQ